MKQHIRTLQKSEKDYTELARLFNTFKVSDSWPDGFGGDYVFNAKIIANWFEDKDLSAHFIITAPDDNSRIVGVCFCCKSSIHANSWYVELLGVEPAYQKQKLGKTLLLYATEFARKKQVQFLGLHTWPGNMKAMPLYKRQGYKWRPGTQVKMENYIPPVLNYPFFKQFFAGNDWYEMFTPIIDQEENREYKGEMDVYTYHFYKDKTNSLEVIIDRTVGRISGFHLVQENQGFRAGVRVAKSNAFIGIDKIPVVLYLENNSSITREISIHTTHSPCIILDGEKECSVILSAGKQKEITFYAGLSPATEPLYPERHPERYSKQEIMFQLHCNGMDFSLYGGIVPLRAFDVRRISNVYTLKAGTSLTLQLNIINHMKKKQELKIMIKGDGYIIPGKEEWDSMIHEFDSCLEIPVTIRDCPTRSGFLEVTLTLKDNRIMSKKKIPFAVFREHKAVTYEIDTCLYIENKELLLYLFQKPDQGSNQISIIDKKRKHGVRGLLPFLGYPVKSEGSEFFTLEFKHDITREPGGVLLTSKASSGEKPGIIMTREIFLPDYGQTCCAKVYLENSSTEEIKNLGIAFSGMYWFDSNSLINNAVRPFTEGIVHTEIREINPDIGKFPHEYGEGWCAVQLLRGYIGYMFNPKEVVKLLTNWNNFGIEKNVGTILPGSSSDPAILHICFTAAWQEIRQKWLDIYTQGFCGHGPEVSLVKGKTTLGITHTGNEQIPFRSLILDRREKKIHVLLKVIREAGLKGRISLDFDGLHVSPKEFTLPEEENDSWQSTVFLHGNPGEIPQERIIRGNLVYDSTGRIYHFPLNLILYNADKEIVISRGKQDTLTYIELDNGFFRFKGSKEFAGSLFHLSTSDDPENYLQSFFPEMKPFCWDNKFIGGIYPKLFLPGTWEKIKCDELCFTDRIVDKGLWKGFGFVSDIIQKPQALRGLQMIVDYVTLPDAPFLMVRMDVMNHSRAVRRFEAQVSINIQTSGTTGDLFYVPGREGIETYRVRDYEVHVENSRDRLWNSYKACNRKYMTGQSLYRKSENELILIYALNLNLFESSAYYQNNLLQGNETKTFYTMVLLGKEPGDFTACAKSNILEILDI